MKNLMFSILAALFISPLGVSAQSENITLTVPDFKGFFIVNGDMVNLRRLPNVNSGKLMEWHSDGGSFDTYAQLFYADTEAAKYRPNASTGAYIEPYQAFNDNYLPLNPEQTEPQNGWYNVIAMATHFQDSPGKANSKPAWIKGTLGYIADVTTDGRIRNISIPINPNLDDQSAKECGKLRRASTGMRRQSGDYKDLGMFCDIDNNWASVCFPIFAGNFLYVAGMQMEIKVDRTQQQPVFIETRTVRENDMQYQEATITVNNPNGIEQAIANHLQTCSDEEFSKITKWVFENDKVPTNNVFFISSDGMKHMMNYEADELSGFETKTYTLAELNKQYAAMNGSQASGSNPSTDNSQVFKVTDEQPEFVGGQTALANYLGNNVVYPTVAIQNNIQGRVVVSFIIEKDGSVSNVELISDVDPLLDAEALRVVKAMPSWNPGKINGKPVRTQYALPITFRL